MSKSTKMDKNIKRKIDRVVAGHQIKREDVEIDLDTRENYPGEFYVMPLMQFTTRDLRAWLEATA